MIKALIFIAALLALAFGGAWLADRPGVVTVDWLDYRLEVSFLTGIMAFGIALVVTILLWVTFRAIWLSPKMVGGFFSGRRRDKGYKALSTGMIAVGVGDLALAQKQATKARKLIGQDPMTLMLEAQTAQLAGNVTKARQSFEAMLDHDDTRALGRRGLFIEAQRRGDGEEALEMARSAMEGGKSAGWAGTALFDMQTASQDWAGALLTLSQNQAAKQITKDEFRRKRAVILTAQAQELDGQEGREQDMRGLLLEAVKLAPGLTPAALMAAKLLKGLGEQRKAGKIVEAAWKLLPHPDLAAIYADIKSDGTALDRLKRVRSLSGLMPDNLESKLALAHASVEAREWADARSLLEPLAEEHLTPRICMMMAQVEEGQEGDFGRVRGWLARAVSAHRDPVWTADGQVSDAWQPTSPVTGKLDVFEWKVPVQELADYNQPLIEGMEPDASSDDAGAETVLLPGSEAKLEEAAEKTASVETVPEEKVDILEPASEESKETSEEPVEEIKAEPISVEAEDKAETSETPDADHKDGEAKAVSKEEETEEDVHEVEFPLPHAPDDPGPKKKEVPNTPEKRFRLF